MQAGAPSQRSEEKTVYAVFKDGFVCFPLQLSAGKVEIQSESHIHKTLERVRQVEIFNRWRWPLSIELLPQADWLLVDGGRQQASPNSGVRYSLGIDCSHLPAGSVSTSCEVLAKGPLIRRSYKIEVRALAEYHIPQPLVTVQADLRRRNTIQIRAVNAGRGLLAGKYYDRLSNDWREFILCSKPPFPEGAEGESGFPEEGSSIFSLDRSFPAEVPPGHPLLLAFDCPSPEFRTWPINVRKALSVEPAACVPFIDFLNVAPNQQRSFLVTLRDSEFHGCQAEVPETLSGLVSWAPQDEGRVLFTLHRRDPRLACLAAQIRLISRLGRLWRLPILIGSPTDPQGTASGRES